jgi:hypothetical protein
MANPVSIAAVIAALLMTTGVASTASAQQVAVKYRDGMVDLRHFECKATISSFVRQVCYDSKNLYMVIQLNETRYHYCEIPADIVAALVNADSVGRFYNANVKGRFDCRTRRVPSY